MKKEQFYEQLGDIDEKIIKECEEQKTRRRKPILKYGAIIAACFVAAIGTSVLYHMQNLSGSKDRNVLLAEATYPEIPKYPVETEYADWEEYNLAYSEWNEANQTLRNQPMDYKDGFDDFFTESTRLIISDTNDTNIVYSPISLYMALGMTAEITDGNSRQQVLDVLNADDIDVLRSRSKSIWQANYMDDGMARCVLATSLWTNNQLSYHQNTIDSISDHYYASVYTGNPNDNAYNLMLRNWLNEQTDGLLAEYTEHISMNPEMILTLASTVNYSGKWNYKFDENMTRTDIFHSSNGEVECDFMNSEMNITYFRGENFSSVSLPIENNGYMRFLLPNIGASPEDLISDDNVIDYLVNSDDSINGQLAEVDLSIPKFDVSSNINLLDGMRELGITDIFDANKSNFSPLTDTTNQVYLSKAEQDTRVLIDEEGCKATALTVMNYDLSAEPQERINFVLDRPFVFEIVSETGLPLFIGVVNNPGQD